MYIGYSIELENNQNPKYEGMTLEFRRITYYTY